MAAADRRNKRQVWTVFHPAKCGRLSNYLKQSIKWWLPRTDVRKAEAGDDKPSMAMHCDAVWFRFYWYHFTKADKARGRGTCGAVQGSWQEQQGCLGFFGKNAKTDKSPTFLLYTSWRKVLTNTYLECFCIFPCHRINILSC